MKIDGARVTDQPHTNQGSQVTHKNNHTLLAISTFTGVFQIANPTVSNVENL